MANAKKQIQQMIDDLAEISLLGETAAEQLRLISFIGGQAKGKVLLWNRVAAAVVTSRRNLSTDAQASGDHDSWASP